MNRRDYIKWRPFNSVVSAKDLLERNESASYRELSKDEIMEYEELLKVSLYLKTNLIITYYENGTLKEITDYVIGLDPLKKNVILKSKTINFRQIAKIKKP